MRRPTNFDGLRRPSSQGLRTISITQKGLLWKFHKKWNDTKLMQQFSWNRAWLNEKLEASLLWHMVFIRKISFWSKKYVFIRIKSSDLSLIFLFHNPPIAKFLWERRKTGFEFVSCPKKEKYKCSVMRNIKMIYGV